MKKNITPKELKARLESGESLKLIDVRSASEYASGHIPGTINIPLPEIREKLLDTSLSEPIVFICQGGVRSDQACKKVMANHDCLFNLTGGTMAWISAGFEVTASPKANRSVDRQAHLVAGLLLCIALIGFGNGNVSLIYLAALPAFGLLLDAITGFCPMTFILRMMPWNKSNGEITASG